ncbi:MAG: CDP-diacylglycerol--glycerol-3-phosphate 3-phosphatidyltransferase [Clostridia bacterium]|nr:CDP-diacylglycerol--glycerol-3-phosphate 3-phosphatidyltransferase [Clostridia bacterium]
MNTPNKLTIARIIATPVFMAALMINFPFHYTVALVLFILASLTDMWDGKMARKYNLVTNFGKFLDPLADKMLTTSAFLGFIALGIGFEVTWITFIVLFREFAISSVRLVSVSSGGKVIAANIWGKLKTVSQMSAIIFALFAKVITSDLALGGAVLAGVFEIITSVLLWASAVLCIISGAIYLIESKDIIDPSK